MYLLVVPNLLEDLFLVVLSPQGRLVQGPKSGLPRPGLLAAGRPRTAGLEERLQYEHGGHAVHGAGPFLNAKFGFAQHAIGFCRRKPFIPKMYWKIESLAQLFGKLHHLAGLQPVFSAHPQRQAQDNLSHRIVANDALQMSKISAFVLALHGLQTLGGDAQQIGDSQPHAARAVVYRQNATCNVHPAII